MSSKINWYCIHTKPQKEAQAAHFCREQLQLEIYFPQVRQYRTIRRVRKLVTTPLFPRYFFCRFDPACYYRAVRYSPDTLDIVHFGDEPAVVGDGLVKSMREWAGDTQDVICITSDLKPGDPIEVTSGPMQGLSATVLHCRDDQERVAILLTILQQGAQMTISRTQIRHSS